MNIQDQLYELAQKRRPRIGIGILNPIPEVVDSLKKAAVYADVVVIGKKVDVFESVETDRLEETAVRLYKEGKIEGLVRGQGDAFRLRDLICAEFGYALEEIVDVSLVGDAFGRVFFLGPISQPQGWTKMQKIKAASGMAELVQDFGLTPKIGFLTAVRPGSRGRNFFLDMTYEIADECVEWCQARGLAAKNYNIETETALEDGCNIIVPPNGVAGNQMLRAIKFLADLPLYSNVLLGVKEHIADSFRNEKSFFNYFIYLAARLNR